MINQRIFSNQIKNFNFIEVNGVKYLLIESTMFDKLRFGDLIAISTFLFFLKQDIIYYNNFRNDEFYFYFCYKPIECYVDNVIDTLSLFDFVWKQEENIEFNENFSLYSMIDKFNIWLFKDYLRHTNIKIDNVFSPYYTDKNIINIKNKFNNCNTKQKVYFYRVINKDYNIERNMSLNDIIYMLKPFENKNIVFIDVNHTLYSLDDLNFLSKYIKFEYKNYNDYNDMFNDIFVYCRIFVTGDCGMSHFVSALPNNLRPFLYLYYRTKPCDVVKDKKILSNIVDGIDAIPDKVTFIPYSPYKYNKMTVILYG